MHMFSKIKKRPEKQLNYTLALFKTYSHRTGLINNRLLKYDTLAQTVSYRDTLNRSYK